MNVRFFGGTKEQYLKLATPRNPLGLYFCADTRELFWGDRLLTDGTRIVATEADRPELSQAADGITYFVEATRNGYVVSPDRTKWIQVIQATGSSNSGATADNENTVKAISFAGIELEEVDGVFTIDRRCAREALGFEVPEGFEDEEIAIASKEYVDKQIAAVTGTDLSDFVKQEDLENYATKEHVQSLIAEAELNNKPDLSNYYTKPETDIAIKSAVNAIIVPNVATLATKEELQNAINNIEHPPVPTKVSELENDAKYVTADQLFEKSREVYSISAVGLAPGAYMTAEAGVVLDKLFDLGNDYPDQLAAATYINDTLIVKVSTFTPGSNLVLETAPSVCDTSEGTYLGYYKYTFTKGGTEKDPNLWCLDSYSQVKTSSLATEQYVIDAIANQVPVADLAKKEEVEEVKTKLEAEVLPTVQELAQKAATQEWVQEQGYLTEHQDLSEYAKKSELPIDYLKEIPAEYITETELANELAKIEHPTIDLTGYATEAYVKNAIAEAELNDKDVDISGLATKDELAAVEAKIPSVDGLASEQFVTDAISGVEHPSELYIIDFNAPNYAEAAEAYNNGKLLLLANAAPDVNSYAMMNYVSEKYITFTKFLMSRSEAYGAFNTYYLRPDNTWEISDEVRLNKVEATIDEATQDINGLVIGKNTYSFDGFATTETINQITQDIENTYVTNEVLEQKNYVTETYVTNNYITQEAAQNTFVTEQRVTEVVETQVNEVVTHEIETRVETVIQEKVDNGEITVNYDTWEETN